MSTALQPVFPCTPKSFVPMFDRRGALNRIVDRFDVQFDDDDLRKYQGDGFLDPVFDIGLGSEQDELRFFPPAVDQFLAWLINPKSPWREFSIEDVMRRQFPMALRTLGGTAITSPVLQMALGCEVKTIIRLIEAKLLIQLGQYRRGNGGEAVVTVASLEKFLTARRIPC